MTNGEMIQKVFNCEVCEPIPEDDIIHAIFPDKNDSAIGFDWSWWNMEYKDLTTKNDLGVDCISRQAVEDAMYDATRAMDLNYGQIMEYIDNLPSVTPQEPKTGHWIKGYTFPDGAYWKCDKCNELIKVKIPMHYCNNCGAKMVEPQESEDKE